MAKNSKSKKTDKKRKSKSAKATSKQVKNHATTDSKKSHVESRVLVVSLFVIILLAVVAVVGYSTYSYFASISNEANTEEQELLLEELLRNGQTDEALELVQNTSKDAITVDEMIDYSRTVARVYTYAGDMDAALGALHDAEAIANADKQLFAINRGIVEIHYEQKDWVSAYDYTKKIVNYLNSLSVEELGEDAYERDLYIEELSWLEGLVNEK